MTAPASTDYTDVFFKHFAALRTYAEKVFIEGKPLEANEDADRELRMREFLSVGARCDFTEKQLISLLYAELF